MKKVILVLMILMFAGGVFAMSEPIVVKADSGMKVKLYAWPAAGGPLLNLAEGVVENGTFTTTFFSLVVQDVRYQVMIIDSDNEKVYDTKFEGFGIDKPLKVDCTGTRTDCVMTVATVVVSSGGVAVVADEESAVTGAASEDVGESASAGWLVWAKENKTILYYVVGGILVLIVLILIVRSRSERFREWLSGFNYFSKDAELARVEREIRKEEELIKKTLKAKEDRKKDIEIAKRRLRLEDKKLEAMISGKKGKGS